MTEQSELNASIIVVICVALMGYLTLRLPRQRAVVPLLLAAAFLPLGQGVVILGLHFYFFRVMLLIGLLRVLIQGEYKNLRVTSLDKVFLCWTAVTMFCGLLVKPTWAQFFYLGGAVYNAMLTYFYIRCMVRELDDTADTLKWFAVIALLLGVFMAIEKLTGRNLFAVFGGVPAQTIIRDGRLRSQGTFLHPIIAGSFGVTLLPLVTGLWFLGRKHRPLAALSIAACVTIIITSASSGPLLALLAAVFGLLLWPLRRSMKWVRRSGVIALLALALLMQAPIWYVFARLSELTGGTGWHRAFIIDAAIEHVGEWWLVGTARTVHWGGYPAPPSDPDNIDITNQYIWEAVKGGLLRLSLFALQIVICFRIIGRRTSSALPLPFRTKMLFWCLGVCLFTHAILFFTIAYFDQSVVYWYWLLAVISSLSRLPVGKAPVSVRQRRVEEEALRITPGRTFIVGAR